MPSETAVRAKNGIVASSHILASKCGADVLCKGGNVVDAAIATSAALCVVQNNMCGLGGDAFALVKLGSNITEINGSGRAAERATIDLYEERGLEAIPSRGPLSCITVPGLVHAWGELLPHCTMELSDLLKPSINYAETGVALNRKYVESIIVSSSLTGFVGWRKLFMPDEKIPEVGSMLKQHDLAVSLQMIADEGIETFYNGKLAERIVSGTKMAGGLIEMEDLLNHFSTVKSPISTDYRGTTIYETSPNSQAATVLLWLNTLEEYDLAGISKGQEKIQDILVATCMKAYEQRAKYIGDPEFVPFPPNFLDKEFARKLLKSPENSESYRDDSKMEGDTTYFAIGDREGNCVSMIQSNYLGFGSGIVPEGTGFVLHNRGCYFSLDRSHHNSLQPKKRTFHTLCASLGEKDGRTLFALGTMGGDIQPQVQVQLLTRILDSKLELQHAINSPRWIVPGTIYERPSSIYFESGLRPSRNLPSTFQIMKLNGLSSLAGHAQAVFFEDGLSGAADPRCDGAVVGV